MLAGAPEFRTFDSTMSRLLQAFLGWPRRLRGAFALVVLSLGFAAGPAFGQGFPFGQDESSLGAEEHPKILEQYGGVYKEGELSLYVATIGGQLTAVAE